MKAPDIGANNSCKVCCTKTCPNKVSPAPEHCAAYADHADTDCDGHAPARIGAEYRVTGIITSPNAATTTPPLHHSGTNRVHSAAIKPDVSSSIAEAFPIPGLKVSNA
ncbi:hypothetical protein MKOR_32380 [Mycolicibacillus koreensis]|nr:hypothetical protein MKOR_32380 [Mycolicibacillus koreensis]